MRILFVSNCEGINGAPKSMIGLICELRKKGVHSLVILPGQGTLEAELKKNEISYRVIKTKRCYYKDGDIQGKRRRLFSEIYNLRAVYRLVKVIKQYKPDIVHSNSFAVDVGAFAAYLTGTPHIWHFREFMEEENSIWHNVFCKEKWLVSKSKAIIAVSEAIKQKYINICGPEKLVVIYNGIDRIYRIERDTPLTDTCLKMLIAGTVCEGKGQQEAMKACKILLERGYKNFQLYVAGSGNKNYYAELKRERNRFGLYPYVKFMGFQVNMQKVRADMDVELVCSKEAFGRVTIEAMLADMLVIGANTGGTKELIMDGYNGILYQHGDADDLADKIEMVLKAPQDYVQCIRNGKRISMERFDIKDTAEKVYDVYKKIIYIKALKRGVQL